MQKQLRNITPEILLDPSKPHAYPPITRLLTPAEFARELKMSQSWLAKARVRGNGPPFVKIGRAVRYPDPAARNWIEAQTRFSTASNTTSQELARSIQSKTGLRKIR
jgi:predicted DNA-binding transcriptional regulator AlpA